MAVLSVLGHCYSIYLGLEGGKGYADLPLIKDESTGEVKDSFRLSSNNKVTNNKW
jgi:hypothetical protein